MFEVARVGFGRCVRFDGFTSPKVRKSKVVPSLVEALSLDNGRTEAMGNTEAEVRALLSQAIANKTYRESGHVLAGNYFYKLRKISKQARM